MPSLRIFLADDQIPPDDISLEEFRRRSEEKHWPMDFIDQCVFMRGVVQALRDHSYHVSTARTYKDALRQIDESDFDLAIIDLGWFIDLELTEADRPAAGWLICDHLDEKDSSGGRATPQIVFSSRFLKTPELSREAARKGKLPVYKEATQAVLESLLAAVRFVETTALGKAGDGTASQGRFRRQLEELLLKSLGMPLKEYQRWTVLTIVLVGVSFVLLLAGVVLTFTTTLEAGALSSASSLLTGAVSALLYRRLASAQRSLEKARTDLVKQLVGLTNASHSG